MDNRIGTMNENGAEYPALCLDGKTPAVRGMDTVHIGNGQFVVLPRTKMDVEAEIEKLRNPPKRNQKVGTE